MNSPVVLRLIDSIDGGRVEIEGGEWVETLRLMPSLEKEPFTCCSPFDFENFGLGFWGDWFGGSARLGMQM